MSTAALALLLSGSSSETAAAADEEMQTWFRVALRFKILI